MHNDALYQKYLQGQHWEKHPTLYAEKFLDFLRSQHFQDQLVDIGCGSGRDVSVFQEGGISASGIDYADEVITKAKSGFPQCTFKVQNVESLDFADASIGAVFMINVMHYVDQRKALAEIERVLQPGGLIFIHWNLEIVDKDHATDYRQDESEILDLISHFEIIERNIFTRVDFLPIEHTHTILELILRKPSRKHLD